MADPTAAESIPPADEIPSAGLSISVLPTDRRRATGSGVALTVIATIAAVFALEWAQSFFISMFLGILFAYTLNPLVAWLEKIRIPRVLGTSIVMIGVVSATVLGTYSLRGQMLTIIDQLPEAVSKISAGMVSLSKSQTGTMARMQSAADDIHKATSQSPGEAVKSGPKTLHAVIDAPGFKLGNFLWSSSMGAAGFIGQAAMVVFLTYFMLLSGDIFKRKLVRITPTLSNKKITLHILNDINASIQRYMFMILVTNVLVALLTWLALRWFGLENAGAWAVAAGLLHVIPYIGPAVTAGFIGMAAFMQFDAMSTALLVAGATLLVATIVGTFFTTWMSGRIARMNTAAVFVSLLFWTWLWGVWGMLLSFPITVMVKVLAQHVEQLEAVAELLSD